MTTPTTPVSPEFARGLELLREAVPLLGGKAADVLRAAVMVLSPLPTPAPKPAPEPAPYRPTFPEPADFQDKVRVGHIAGEAVIGCQGWDTVDGSTRRYLVTVDLAGLHLMCDGDNLEVGSYNRNDGMPLRDVAALAELWQSGAVQQLTTIARRWLADAPALDKAA